MGAAVAKATQQPSRAAWDKAMAVHLGAVAASKAFDLEYDRISTAHAAAVDAVPHVTVSNPDRGRTLTTANRFDLPMARSSARELRYVKTCAYEGVKQDHAFLVAAEKREAKIAKIDRRFNWDAVNEHTDALANAICETEAVLLDMPAPDGEALQWKVNRLYKPGDGIWSEGVEDQTHADLHRFLSTGRA
jgi:hypothetical protein